MTEQETLAETMLVTRKGGQTRLRLRFVALVLVVAVAAGLLGTTRPARADEGDVAKALVALAIVGIIAQGMSQEKRHEPPPRQVRVPRVPDVCAIEIQGQRTAATVYGENCLRQQGFQWRLPERCARPARIYGQRDRIFTEQCLREAGFRIGGNRN